MDYLAVLRQVSAHLPYEMAQGISVAGPVFQNLFLRRLASCAPVDDHSHRMWIAFNLIASWLLYQLYGGDVPEVHHDGQCATGLLRGVDYMCCNTPGDMIGLQRTRNIPDNGTPSIAYAQAMALIDAYVAAAEMQAGTFDPGTNVVSEPTKCHFYILDHKSQRYIRPWLLLFAGRDVDVLREQRTNNIGDLYDQHLWPSGGVPTVLVPITAAHMPLNTLTTTHRFRAMYTVVWHLCTLCDDLAMALVGYSAYLDMLQGGTGYEEQTHNTQALSDIMVDPESMFYKHNQAYLEFSR